MNWTALPYWQLAAGASPKHLSDHNIASVFSTSQTQDTTSWWLYNTGKHNIITNIHAIITSVADNCIKMISSLSRSLLRIIKND